MDCVESSEDLAAEGYPLTLKYDAELPSEEDPWPYHFDFDAGELRCSASLATGQRICYVPREAETVLASHRPSFVYLDVGCWADDSNGWGRKRRDFGLMCGQHVYLCEYVGGGCMPTSRVPAVRDFFLGLANLHCGVRVVGYARARDFDRKTWQDPGLYLLLGDLHLPPVAWFHASTDAVQAPRRGLPPWIADVPAMDRQPRDLVAKAWNRAEWRREANEPGQARAYDGENPDISGNAGESLVRFLRALAALDAGVRKQLHFIHLGDLFELWIGRKYHLVPGPDGMPRWRLPDSPDIVANWCLQVMIQNAPVFEALKLLESSGLGEVKYLAGNHDGYLLKPELPDSLALPARDPFYRGLNGDLLAEHGHRFDSWNFDNVKGGDVLSGPGVTKLLMLVPSLRRLEGPLGKMTFWQPSQRDLHVLGAALLFLHEQTALGHKPFSIYAMGHSHDRMLVRADVRVRHPLEPLKDGSRPTVYREERP